jgi:hypothetical protein
MHVEPCTSRLEAFIRVATNCLLALDYIGGDDKISFQIGTYGIYGIWLRWQNFNALVEMTNLHTFDTLVNYLCVFSSFFADINICMCDNAQKY